MAEREGGCLCGAVRLTAEVPHGEFMACHCVQCQRWTGGGPLYSIDATNVVLSGAEKISEYLASHWGARGYCGICGSTLYWRMQNAEIDSVAVGILDDQSGLRLTREIFVDYRPDWLPAQAGASQSTEAEELAKLAEGPVTEEME